MSETTEIDAPDTETPEEWAAGLDLPEVCGGRSLGDDPVSWARTRWAAIADARDRASAQDAEITSALSGEWPDGADAAWIAEATHEVIARVDAEGELILCSCPCSCDHLAHGHDDGGPVCEDCASYYVDASGEVICARTQTAESPCRHCGETIDWTGILTGQPGASNWREGSCSCRGWRETERGGRWDLEEVEPKDDDDDDDDDGWGDASGPIEGDV